MSTIQFPSSPTNGQTHVDGDITYTYSTTLNAWEVTPSGGVGTNATTTDQGANALTAPVAQTDLAAGTQALLTGAMQRDGSVTATADIPMGNFSLTGMRAAAANGEPVRFDEYSVLATQVATNTVTTATKVPLDGSTPMTGNLDMGAGTLSVVGLRAAAAAGEAVRYDEHNLLGLTDTTIAAPANMHGLFHDGTDWKNRFIALTDLNDAFVNGTNIPAIDTANDRMALYDASGTATGYITVNQLGAHDDWVAITRVTGDTWLTNATSDLIFSFAGNAATTVTLGATTLTRITDVGGWISDGTDTVWVGSSSGWGSDVRVRINGGNFILDKPAAFTDGEILVAGY